MTTDKKNCKRNHSRMPYSCYGYTHHNLCCQYICTELVTVVLSQDSALGKLEKKSVKPFTLTYVQTLTVLAGKLQYYV